MGVSEVVGVERLGLIEGKGERSGGVGRRGGTMQGGRGSGRNYGTGMRAGITN